MWIKNKVLGIALTVLVCNSVLFSQMRLGLDVSGKFKISDPVNETYDSDKGIVIGYDQLLQDEDKMQLGVGGEFMMARGVEEFSTGKGSFHSFYGYGKYALDKTTYAYGRIGYSIHSGDDDYTDCGTGCNITPGGGLMFAFGGGYALTPSVSLEGLFSSHSGDFTFSSTDDDELYSATYKLSYTRFSIGLRYTLQ